LQKYAEGQLVVAKTHRGTFDQYKITRKLERIAVLRLRCEIELGEYDEAVRHFKEKYPATDREVSLYVLLKWLESYELRELWVREYRVATGNGIAPRDSLRKKYELFAGSTMADKV
jgi:hypothetical protein